MMAMLYRVVDNRILQVTIVIPSQVIAYYEQLTDFLQRELAPEAPDLFEENIQHGRNDFLPTQKKNFHYRSVIMYTNKKNQTITILLLIVFTLACSSVQVGLVTPVPEDAAVSLGESEGEMSVSTGEDFSHLWVEYWNPVYNYGVAIPAHWRVETESQSGYMMLWSYEQAFFDANSIKGNWANGEAPEGAVKLDFVPFGNIFPEQSLETAASNALGADPEMTTVLSVEPLNIGNFEAVKVTTGRIDNLEDTTSNIAIRLSPETILYVAAYPNNGHDLDDVQTILSTLVLSKDTPIVKPSTAPRPPFEVDINSTATVYPPTPGPRLSDANCDPGYLGSVEEVVEVVQYSIGIGNHEPFSYLIGEPFVFGFWQSEGLSLSRGQAYEELVNNYLPSPKEFIVYAEPTEFPDLDGIPLENMWGPDVDVAGSLYSTGWGPDGTSEAIVVIARCQEETYDTYFWYSVLIGQFK